MQYFNDATTDDNGAYVKSNNTKKNYYIQYDTERQIVTSTKIALSISPYSARMRENAGKMQTRITPNTDSFYAVLFTILYTKVFIITKGMVDSIMS